MLLTPVKLIIIVQFTFLGWTVDFLTLELITETKQIMQLFINISTLSNLLGALNSLCELELRAM